MSQVQMENKGKVRGDSAYEIAVKDGFVGTEAEWLESLKNNVKVLSKTEVGGFYGYVEELQDSTGEIYVNLYLSDTPITE